MANSARSTSTARSVAAAPRAGSAHATASGSGGGTFSGGSCTTAGGTFYLTIGRAHQGRYFSIVVSTPTAPGAVSGGLIQWGNANPYAIGATTSSITFNAGLRSGSLSGRVLDATRLAPTPGAGTFSYD